MEFYEVYVELKNGDIYKLTAKITKHKKCTLATLWENKKAVKRIYWYSSSPITYITHLVEYTFKGYELHRITII